jgi:Biotin-lipoyl like
MGRPGQNLNSDRLRSRVSAFNKSHCRCHAISRPCQSSRNFSKVIASKCPRLVTAPPIAAPTNPYDNDVAGAGIVEPASEVIALAIERGGVVSRVDVVAGEFVKAGQPLFSIDARNYQLRGRPKTGTRGRLCKGLRQRLPNRFRGQDATDRGCEFVSSDSIRYTATIVVIIEVFAFSNATPPPCVDSLIRGCGEPEIMSIFSPMPSLNRRPSAISSKPVGLRGHLLEATTRHFHKEDSNLLNLFIILSVSSLFLAELWWICR